MADINFGVNVLPNVNNTYNFGSSSKQWNNIYTKNIYAKNDIQLTVSKDDVSSGFQHNRTDKNNVEHKVQFGCFQLNNGTDSDGNAIMHWFSGIRNLSDNKILLATNDSTGQIAIASDYKQPFRESLNGGTGTGKFAVLDGTRDYTTFINKGPRHALPNINDSTKYDVVGCVVGTGQTDDEDNVMGVMYTRGERADYLCKNVLIGINRNNGKLASAISQADWRGFMGIEKGSISVGFNKNDRTAVKTITFSHPHTTTPTVLFSVGPNWNVFNSGVSVTINTISSTSCTFTMRLASTNGSDSARDYSVYWTAVG